jgi:hypothetical protein
LNERYKEQKETKRNKKGKPSALSKLLLKWEKGGGKTGEERGEGKQEKNPNSINPRSG